MEDYNTALDEAKERVNSLIDLRAAEMVVKMEVRINILGDVWTRRINHVHFQAAVRSVIKEFNVEFHCSPQLKFAIL